MLYDLLYVSQKRTEFNKGQSIFKDANCSPCNTNDIMLTQSLYSSNNLAMKTLEHRFQKYLLPCMIIASEQ